MSEAGERLLGAAREARDMAVAHQVTLAAKEECRAENLFLGTGSALDVMDKHIARAIMAERERCARIADAHQECPEDCGDVIASLPPSRNTDS